MRTNQVSTRSRGRNLEECGCRRCNGTEGPPRELEELPGLEKDQNRRARLAMRCGLLLCSLPAQLRRSRTKPDQKTGCTRPSTKSNGSCVECENTPTMLWMSSSKRNI